MSEEAVRMDGDSHVMGGVDLNKRPQTLFTLSKEDGRHVIQLEISAPAEQRSEVSPNMLVTLNIGERAEMLCDDDMLLFRGYKSLTHTNEIRSNPV